MNGKIASVALLLAVARFAGTGTGLAAGNIRTERVHFKPGATSAVVEASIKGDEIVDYILGGGKAGNAELEFDGTSDPSNPTVPPAAPAADLAGTQVLIPQFESYTEGQPVPAMPADP